MCSEIVIIKQPGEFSARRKIVIKVFWWTLEWVDFKWRDIVLADFHMGNSPKIAQITSDQFTSNKVYIFIQRPV